MSGQGVCLSQETDVGAAEGAGDFDRVWRLYSRALETLISLSIRELPKRLRQPMELVAGGVDYRSVADALGITELNVRKRIQKAREELRRRLGAYRRGDCRLGATLQTPPGWRHAALAKVEREEPLAVGAVGWTRVLSAEGVERDHLLWVRQPASDGIATRLRRLRAYIARHPGGWRKRLELARLFCEIDRSQEAVVHYQEVVEAQPRHLPAWLELLELLEPPEGGEDALPRAALLPPVLDQLDVGVALGAFDAEEHGASSLDTRSLAVLSSEIKGDHRKLWHQDRLENRHSIPKVARFTGNCPREARANC